MKEDAREVYSSAVAQGYDRAVKNNKEQQWFQEHPEFTTPNMMLALQQGSTLYLLEVIDQASQIPGVIGVYAIGSEQFIRTTNTSGHEDDTQ